MVNVRGRGVASAALALVLAATACTGDEAQNSGTAGPTASASANPLPVKVVYLESLEVEGSDERMIPAFQGAQLAVDQAIRAGDLPVQLELVAMDTEGSPARADVIARELATDSDVLAIIAAPFLNLPESAAATLAEARIPTVSLSTVAPRATISGTTWFRAVAGQVEQAEALAELIKGLPRARRGVCVAGDGGLRSDELVRVLVDRLGERVDLSLTVSADGSVQELVTQVAGSGCGLIFWGGFSSAATTIRLQLAEADLADVTLVAADGTKDQVYLTETGTVGDGTLVSCPCVDLTTSTALAATRFIQDYQSESGVPPGVYAVEGWDVAGLLVASIRSGATTRAEIASFLQEVEGFDGLAHRYSFDDAGELAGGLATIRFYRDEGGRWIPFTPSDSEETGV